MIIALASCSYRGGVLLTFDISCRAICELTSVRKEGRGQVAGAGGSEAGAGLGEDGGGQAPPDDGKVVGITDLVAAGGR